MKHVLLTALSLLLVANSPAIADDRTSAGAATPVKLGGGDRSKPATSAKSAASKKEEKTQSGSTKTEAKTGAASEKTNKNFGSFQNQESTTPAEKTGFGPPGVTRSVGSQTGVSVVEQKKPEAAPEQTKSTEIRLPGQKTALGGRGLIPPPPAMRLATPTPPVAAAKKASKKAEAPVEKLVTIGSGGPFTFSGKAKEEFATTFNWQPDQSGDKLTFTANFSPVNMPAASHRFNWLRILLGNQIIADEHTLKGKSNFTLDLTGKVERGINQLTVSAQGLPGSTFEWKLTTPKKCVLRSVDPDEVLVGKDVVLKGQNFDPVASKDIVNLGPKTLVPTTATPTDLKVRIPKDFPPGDYLVKVTVDGMASHEIKLTIRGIPELTGTNLNGVPPGATLVIFGKNFSKKMNENKVMFDQTPGQVVSCSTNEISVIVPNFSNNVEGDTAHVSGQVGIPIRVKVGKIDAINTVPINVGNSTWQDPGMRGGPDTPVVPPDWRRLME